MINIDYIIGDSIAAGTAIYGFGLKSRSGSYGVKSKDDKGISKVGAPPNEILGFLNEIGKDKLNGKNIILSCGISNGPTKIEVVKQQLNLLKEVNATVFIIGVSNNPPANLSGLKGMNDTLEKLSKDYGYTFFGGFTPSSDKIHPEYNNYYKSNIKPILDAYNPASPTTGTQSGTQSQVIQTGTQSSTLNGTQSAYVDPPIVSSSALSGKMMIKKKSGPGEITGIVEIPIQTLFGYDYGKFEFTDLQFTDPGDYVITLSSDSPDISTIDLKVKVNPVPEVIPQEPKADVEQKNATGNRPIIAQIDQPTIKLPPIVMPQDKTAGPTGQTVITDGIGYTPVVEYGGTFMKTEDIVSFRIFHDGIVPKLDLTFKDSMNLMKGDQTPKDQTPIQIFLNSTSPHIKSIHMIFKIENFDKDPEKAGQKYRISGTLDIPDLYVQNNKSYNGTSFEAIRAICKELGLGFNSNIINTDDSMNWRNPNKRPYEFIMDIIRHSYISDESYMSGYIDYYYCFNYVDVDKEFKRNNGTDVVIDTAPAQKQGQGAQGDDARIIA